MDTSYYGPMAIMNAVQQYCRSWVATLGTLPWFTAAVMVALVLVLCMVRKPAHRVATFLFALPMLGWLAYREGFFPSEIVLIMAIAVAILSGWRAAQVYPRERHLVTAHERIRSGLFSPNADAALVGPAQKAYRKLGMMRQFIDSEDFNRITAHQNALAWALAFDGHTLLRALTEAQAFLRSRTDTETIGVTA